MSCVRSLFVDLNAYFASCEQHLRPELRGRPVAVAALDVANTACIAASYEAKARGVKTGTHVREARRLCPDLVIVEGRPREYIRLHHEILAAIDAVLPVHSVDSIDECHCLLDARQRTVPEAVAVAKAVKRSIYDRIGPHLRCSVGLAPNRFLAKVASEMQKPNGLVVLTSERLPEALYRLDLIDLPGIGERMLLRLHRAGVRDVPALCRSTEAELAAVWGGVEGRRWWHWLRGLQWELPKTRRRTVGHSHVLPPAWREPDKAQAVAVRLAHKAAVRLRSIRHHARKLALQLRMASRGGEWTAVRPLGYCRSTLAIVRELDRLRPHWPDGPVLRVSLTLFDLLPDESVSLPLFGRERREGRLDDVLDRINAKFGGNGVYYGGNHDARGTAPTRIAFSRIPSFSPSFL